MEVRPANRARRYGPLALGFHFGVEACVTGCFYVAIKYGLDVTSLLQFFHDCTGIDTSKTLSPGSSTLVIAYALTGVLTGVPRTIFTVVATPAIARKLGWKPRKPS